MNARRGLTLIELLVVMVILSALAGAIAAVALRVSSSGPARAARADIDRIALALDDYRMDFRKFPPDTGFGLEMNNPPVDCDYDPGSLWRYLTRPVFSGQRVYGPYLEWNQKQLKPYEDLRFPGQNFCLVDPWGEPYGYVGNQKRVIHNQGVFDLWSAGADRVSAYNNNQEDGGSGYTDVQTVSPMSRLEQDNRAYNLQDDDRNGIVDDANEFGPEASQNGDVGDDINNWTVAK